MFHLKARQYLGVIEEPSGGTGCVTIVASSICRAILGISFVGRVSLTSMTYFNFTLLITDIFLTH